MIAPWFDEIALAIGVLLLLFAAVAFRRTRTFIARCRVATARIAAYTTDDADEGPVFHFPIIRFRDDAGAEHEIQGRGTQEVPRVGEEVSVTYDPAYPANAWITGSASPWVIPWIVLIAGIGAVIASVLVRASASR